jgi:hypothetical protein
VSEPEEGKLYGPREADLDGSRHVEGGSCCRYTRCGDCGSARLHVQSVSIGGVITICESCPRDRRHWWLSGTFARLEVH